MDELEVFNLYEKKNKKNIKEFNDKVDSNLIVKTDYEKVTEDLEWIEIMELTLPYIDNIFRNPNRFIINEEEIVKIERARKITVESIKHLSKNTNFIQEIDPKTGDVKPSKILNINKEEDYVTYENRLIYSLVQNMKFFIARKKKAIEERCKVQEKNDKSIAYKASSKLKNENININIQLNTSLDGQGNINNEQLEILNRIEKIEQKIRDVSSNEVYKIIDKKHMALVTSPIKKTNVVLKNVNFQYAVKLWNFLQENLEDKSKHVKEKTEYEDNEDLKKLMNETFLLDYLVIDTLDKDKDEAGDVDKEIRDQKTDQLIENIININSDLTIEDLKALIVDKYLVVQYKHQASIKEIQKIFKTHIDKYLEKIK